MQRFIHDSELKVPVSKIYKGDTFIVTIPSYLPPIQRIHDDPRPVASTGILQFVGIIQKFIKTGYKVGDWQVQMSTANIPSHFPLPFSGKPQVAYFDAQGDFHLVTSGTDVTIEPKPPPQPQPSSSTTNQPTPSSFPPPIQPPSGIGTGPIAINLGNFGGVSLEEERAKDLQASSSSTKKSTANEIEWLVDGKKFFGKMHSLIKNTPADCFIYICTWAFNPEMKFGPSLESFQEALLDRAKNGVSIKILLWDSENINYDLLNIIDTRLPDEVSSLAKKTVLSNGFSGMTLDQVKKALQHPNIKILLSKHTGPFGSHHQKFAIFGPDRQMRESKALVGGFNLVQSYYDSPMHHMNIRYPVDPDAHLRGKKPWHDAGVYLEGQVINDLEDVFVERWNSSLPQSAPPEDRLSPHHLAGPSGNQSFPCSPLVSGMNNLGYEDIYSWCHRAFRNAENLIYTENQYFVEEGLIDAIRDNFLEKERSGKRLVAILVISNPLHDEMLPSASVGSIGNAVNKTQFIHGVTLDLALILNVIQIHNGFHYHRLYKLMLDTCESILLADGTDVRRPSNPSDWQVVTGQHKKEDNKIITNIPGVPKEILLSDIEGIYGGVQVYTLHKHAGFDKNEPVMVHSKLAIIDDKYVCIGSANFNPRSRYIDSELNVVIDHPGKAFELRKSLWEEHGGGRDHSFANAPPLTNLIDMTQNLSGQVLEFRERAYRHKERTLKEEQLIFSIPEALAVPFFRFNEDFSGKDFVDPPLDLFLRDPFRKIY